MTELISGLIAEDADIESNLDYSFDMMTQALQRTGNILYSEHYSWR